MESRALIWTHTHGDDSDAEAALPPVSCRVSATTGRSFITPLGGKTTDWRAGCGRSARPVRREGERHYVLPTPIICKLRHCPEGVRLSYPWMSSMMRLIILNKKGFR